MNEIKENLKTDNKITNGFLIFGLMVWFTNSIYLSINSVVNFFVKTDPYISKAISAGSFILLMVVWFYNFFKKDAKNRKGLFYFGKPTGCKNCKKKD